MPKPKVYLAGPISGCNDEQKNAWRREVKHGFAEEFEFVDPMDDVIDHTSSDYALVQADIAAIKSCDAVLANMWRESIGTAFGILHAHDAGKIVVACDPNLIGNRMLAFYADAVEKNLPAALNRIRMFLRAQQLILEVEKSNGNREPFDRQKLTKAVRRACSDAAQSDLGPARAIVSYALEKLLGDAREERVVTTSQIEDKVWEAMAELGGDPVVEADFDHIRRAWENFGKQEARLQPTSTASVRVNDTPLMVKCDTVGTHSTIWGNSTPQYIRRMFDEMKRVTGISEIRYRAFANAGNPPNRPQVKLTASKTPYIIEGVCYDKGEKGTQQTFQIWVSNPPDRDEVLSVLRDHLSKKGYIRTMV